MISNSLLIGVVAILVIGFSPIPIVRRIYKKSIISKLFTIVLIPVVLSSAMAYVVGAQGIWHLLWAAPVVLVSMAMICFTFTKVIRNPLQGLSSKILLLSKGDLNLSFRNKFLESSTETSELMHTLCDHVNSLKNTATFASHVGEGNLNVEYALLGENDSLGKAMLDMRANLRKAEAEMEKSRREDERRNWATQGLAKFADILRRDNDNLETLSHNIISNMVKYLDANQGGIFILNDNEIGEDHYLEMKACFAFDRKKFADKQIHPGDGLVGTCFLEGEPIYMTDVPDSYIHITSGLGDAKPKAVQLSPLKVNNEIFGVIELASFHPFEPYQREFIEKVSESIASTIGSVKVNIRTNKLLMQTKLQAEEMANHEEELRQNMEEMQATQDEMQRREFELQETLGKMKKIQAAIEDKEYEMTQFHNAILETVSIVEFSAEGYIVNINDNLLRLFGATDHSDFVGKHISEFISKEEYDAAWRNIMQGKKWDTTQQVEAQGKTVHLRQRYIPICNKDSELLRLFSMVFLEDHKN